MHKLYRFVLLKQGGTKIYICVYLYLHGEALEGT